jgi:hypothetical protein
MRWYNDQILSIYVSLIHIKYQILWLPLYYFLITTFLYFFSSCNLVAYQYIHCLPLFFFYKVCNSSVIPNFFSYIAYWCKHKLDFNFKKRMLWFVPKKFFWKNGLIHISLYCFSSKIIDQFETYVLYFTIIIISIISHYISTIIFQKNVVLMYFLYHYILIIFTVKQNYNVFFFFYNEKLYLLIRYKLTMHTFYKK